MNNLEKKYDALIKRLFSGSATQEEVEQLSRLEMVEHRMSLQWQASAHKEVSKKAGNRIWENIDKRCNAQKKRHPFIMRNAWKLTAACITILLAVGGAWHVLGGSKEQKMEQFHVFASNHQILLLPDKSKVWMQPGSSVHYTKAFNTDRKIWLKGDATFEVTKRNKEPFRVYISGAFVEVKGTVFRVINKHTNTSQVTLFSGLVDFHVQASGKRTSMHPNQQIIHHPDGSIKLENVYNISWQDGLYRFNDMPLKGLITIVNSLHNIQIELANGVQTHNRFSGTIRYDERPSEVVEKICYNMSLKYRRQENKMIIYNPNE